MTMVSRLPITALVVAMTAICCCPSSAVESKSFDLSTSLATKTAYWDQRSRDDTFAEELKGYELLQVQQVSRHGERYVCRPPLTLVLRIHPFEPTNLVS